MIREKTHPCASVISVFFDKATRMASMLLCDLWANSLICFFKRIGRLVVSHRSRRFAQMHFTSSLR